MRRRHGVYLAILLLTPIGVSCAHMVMEKPKLLTSELGPLQLTQAAVLVVALILAIYTFCRVGGPSKPGGPMALCVTFMSFFLAWREVELDSHISGIHAFSWNYLFKDEVHIGIGLLWAVPSMAIVLYLGYQALKHRDAIWTECFSAWPGRVRLLLLGGVIVLVISQLWDKGRSLGERFGLAAFEHGTTRDPLPEELLELCGELVVLFFVIDYTLWRLTPTPDETAATTDTPASAH